LKRYAKSLPLTWPLIAASQHYHRRDLPSPRTEAESSVAFWCLGRHLGVAGAQNGRGDLLGDVRDEFGGRKGDALKAALANDHSVAVRQ